MASIKVGKRKGLAAAAFGAAGLMMAAAPAMACTPTAEYTSLHTFSGHVGATISASTNGTGGGLPSTDPFRMYFINQSKATDSSNVSSPNAQNCHHAGTMIGSKVVYATKSAAGGKGHISAAYGTVPTGANQGTAFVCFADPSQKSIHAQGSGFASFTVL